MSLNFLADASASFYTLKHFFLSFSIKVDL